MHVRCCGLARDPLSYKAMSKHTTRDDLYAKPRGMIVDFSFDESVVKVFPDMIRRSVPGYSTIITLIGLLAEQYAQPGTACYDLGCSLGASTLSMRERIAADHHIIAVDNSPAMIESCRKNIGNEPGVAQVSFVCDDIQNVKIENASVVVLNFTLQFIAPELRLPVLQGIHDGLHPGGILILSEKLSFPDHDEQALLEDMHLAFKRANGYSELEISQKRSALEKVLLPETREQHLERLRQAGFAHSHVWFQSFNFASFIAVK